MEYLRDSSCFIQQKLSKKRCNKLSPTSYIYIHRSSMIPISSFGQKHELKRQRYFLFLNQYDRSLDLSMVHRSLDLSLDCKCLSWYRGTNSCMAILLSMVKFPALDICKGRKKRTGKLSAKHRKYTMHGMEEEQGEGEGERSSLQSKHEGKMLVGSSPGSCTPMQVQVSIHHCCTREVSMNRQLHPTTSPPGLDRRELFGLLVVFVAAASFFFTTVAKWWWIIVL